MTGGTVHLAGGSDVSGRAVAMSSQRAFRALLAAAAEPGTIHVVEGLPMTNVSGQAAWLASTIAEGLTATYSDVPGEPISAGRPVEDCGEAAVVALADANRSGVPALIQRLRRGSRSFPELGAKLFIGCRAVGATDGLVVDLQGPGIPHTRRLALAGVPVEVVDSLIDANQAFPAGIDTWLVDAGGRIAALPRSCQITKGES